MGFFFPEHAQTSYYEQMCERYRQLSKEQLEKHIQRYKTFSERKELRKKLDDDFFKKLQAMDDEEDYDISLDDELPIKKPVNAKLSKQ